MKHSNESGHPKPSSKDFRILATKAILEEKWQRLFYIKVRRLRPMLNTQACSVPLTIQVRRNIRGIYFASKNNKTVNASSDTIIMVHSMFFFLNLIAVSLFKSVTSNINQPITFVWIEMLNLAIKDRLISNSWIVGCYT